MAITTLEQLRQSLLPTVYNSPSNNTTSNDPNRISSLFVGTPPTTASGNVLTNTSTGAIKFANPASGNTYLADFRVGQEDAHDFSSRNYFVVDRLWHGLLASTTAPQTINSVTFPARDVNGTSNGEGIYLTVENSSSNSTGGWNVVVTYTNSAGVTGRVGQRLNQSTQWTAFKDLNLIWLQAGDTGVRSVQSVSFSVAPSTPVYLVAYRVIAHVYSETCSSNQQGILDAVTTAMPRIYDGSYLQYFVGNSTRIGTIMGGHTSITLAQG